MEISHHTLAGLAARTNRRKGPPYYRQSWSVTRYNRQDLDNWFTQKMQRME